MSIEFLENSINSVDLIDSIPQGICICRPINTHPYLEFIAWNKEMTSITGYTIDEINQLDCRKLFISRRHDIDLSLIEEVLNVKNNFNEREYRILKKDLSLSIITINISYVKTSDGKDNMLLLVKDITKNKLEEMKLRKYRRHRKHKNIYMKKEIEDNDFEDIIEKREKIFKEMIENTIDMITIIGIDGKVKYATPSHYNVLGFTNTEIKNSNLLTLIHPNDLENAINIIERMIKDGNQIKFQCRFRCVNGTYKYIEVCGKMLRHKNSLDEFIFSSRDLTERILIEEKLKKSEKKYRDLFNNVSDAVYVHKIDSNGEPTEFIEVNDVACERTGLTREQLSKMKVFQLNPTSDPNTIKDKIKVLRNSGNIIHQTESITKSGELMPVEVNTILSTLDNEEYVLSLSRDISERKSAEKALQESEERYRLLIEAMPYGVFIIKEHKIMFCNKAGLGYLGASSKEEVRGKDYSDFIDVQLSPLKNQREKFRNLFVNKDIFTIEVQYNKKCEFGVLNIETTITPYPFDGQQNALLVVIRDITDSKKVETLEKDMAEKSRQLYEAVEFEKLRTEFFANISHELRTPINVIFSTLQLLTLNMNKVDIDEERKEKYKKHVSIMKQNCYRLIRLINNIIDVTKIDSGFFDLNLSNNNIVNVIEGITLSVADYIENKGIFLIFDTEVEEKVLACDADKIERIILNLISNAVKFTKKGGEILVKIYDRDDHILVSVKDTGIGVVKEKQKSIFERFVQVDKSMSRNREGSGIGLSLVRALVEMHNGKISVKSEPDKGSEFIIELPVTLIEGGNKNLYWEQYSTEANLEKINIEFSDIYF